MAVAVDAPRALTLRRRARTFRLADVVLLGAAVALVRRTPLSVLSAWFEGGAARVHRVHDIGAAVLAGSVLLSLLVELVHPERKVAALQQFGLGGIALVAGGTLSRDGGLAYLGAAVIVVTFVLGLFHPARAEFFARPRRINVALAVFTICGGVPLIQYALRMAKLQRIGAALGPHAAKGHPAPMAAMAFALVLCAVLATLHPHGWRLPAWCAGAGVALMGAASVMFPDAPGSFGGTWGMGALTGGVLFLLYAERRHRIDTGAATL